MVDVSWCSTLFKSHATNQPVKCVNSSAMYLAFILTWLCQHHVCVNIARWGKYSDPDWTHSVFTVKCMAFPDWWVNMFFSNMEPVSAWRLIPHGLSFNVESVPMWNRFPYGINFYLKLVSIWKLFPWQNRYTPRHIDWQVLSLPKPN